MEPCNFNYDELRKAIAEAPDDSTIYLGADSKVYSHKGERMCAYVTVVILHFGSVHGARLFKALRIDRDYGQLRTRLMAEVGDVIAVGNEISDAIMERNFEFEVHLDINTDPRYKSSVLVKEATGYVLGTLGVIPKLKPDAYAASHVADRDAVREARRRRDSHAMKKKYRRLKSVA